MDTDFESKYSKAINELSATSILPSNSRPPSHRIARRLGFQIRPPHYNTYAKNWLFGFLLFTPLWGLAKWSIRWSEEGTSIFVAVISSAFAGLMFGCAMAFYYRRSSLKHKLTDWSQL